MERIYLMQKRGADIFHPGRLVMTIGVNDAISRDEAFAAFVMESVRKHISGDWGDISLEDVQSNNCALESEERLFSVYRRDEQKIWIITEADRTITTILFPSEY